MTNYTADDLLRIAKRHHNTKRTYLLLNPLQGKHIPVSPSVSLQMMGTLGEKLFKKYPETKLVVGFAETATAIGAAVATAMPETCVYIQTTREKIPEVEKWVLFQEEHSHAVEQKLAADHLQDWIQNTQIVIFVDDEISTGKTMRNAVLQLRQLIPQLQEKKIVIASLLNRVSKENLSQMEKMGIHCECLVRLPEEDYTRKVEQIRISGAMPAAENRLPMVTEQMDCNFYPDPRRGVMARRYRESCDAAASEFLDRHEKDMEGLSSILVLGTEECMYPGLCLGAMLEKRGAHHVFFHATTRSPIGICGDSDYPIRSGVCLRSFYDHDRKTFLYNVRRYDAIIVVSDTADTGMEAFENLIGAIPDGGNVPVYYLHGGNQLWRKRL